jgi:hypothetical protein
MSLPSLLGALLLVATAEVNTQSVPWIAAQGAADFDGDAVPDEIRIETAHPTDIVDDLPCAGCGHRVEGVFAAVVALSRSKRAVSSPVALHEDGETLWFWHHDPAPLAIADYNGDGRLEFNLGRFVNSNKWEYGLFTVGRDGRVTRLAKDAPEIYVAPGDEPSSRRIEVIPGGFRFHDFGNAGEIPGWWTFTCLWQRGAQKFACTDAPDPAAGKQAEHR